MKKNFSIWFLLLALNGVYAQQWISINDPNRQEKFFQQEKRHVLKNDQNREVRNRLFEANPQFKSFSQHNEGDTLSLDFFADKKYEAVVRRVTVGYDGMVGITAQILNTEAGYCYISVSDDGVAISAELPQKNEFFSNFQPSIVINGGKYLSEHKLTDIQENGGGICEHQASEPSANNGMVPNSAVSKNIDAPVTIRLMVVYTPAAKASVSNIDLAIDQALQRSNQVMANSLTGVTLQLVHKQEVNYMESSSLNNDLRNVKNSNDGIIDEVHLWRGQHQADLVSLIIAGSGSSLGEAYILNDDEYGSPRDAFSVVRVTNIANNYTLVHEIGHNFGCGHHVELGGGALYPYSHGRRNTSTLNTRYSTIMTYETGNYSHEPTVIYPRIPYFSSPDIKFEGSAIGDNSKENNALTIRKTKELISRYSIQLPFIDAFLKDITLSEGALSPAFNPATTQYQVTVGNHVTSIDVVGIPNSQHSYVINATGKQLAVGDNVVEIKVESDWSDKKTYNVTITRQSSTPPTIPPAPPVVFPTAPTVTYHPAQKLSDIALINGSGDGKFAWANPSTVPTAGNKSYEVVFTPNDMINFDYSNVALRQSVQLVVDKATQKITFPVIPEKQLTDAPFRVNASVDTGLPLSYESSDTNIAVISSDGSVTIKSAGTTMITVFQEGDENYLKSVESRQLTINNSTTTGEIEYINEKGGYLYPNPVVRGGTLSMIIGADMPLHDAVIEIYDFAGNLKQRIPVNHHSTKSLQAPSEQGIYLFVLKTKNHIKTVMKVIVN